MMRRRFCLELRVHNAALCQDKIGQLTTFYDAIIIRTFNSDFLLLKPIVDLLEKPCWLVTFEEFSVFQLREDLRKLEEATWYLVTLTQEQILCNVGLLGSLVTDRSSYLINNKLVVKRLWPSSIPESPVALDDKLTLDDLFTALLGSRLAEIVASTDDQKLLWAFKLCCVAEYDLMATILAEVLRTKNPETVLPFLYRFRGLDWIATKSTFNAKSLKPTLDSVKKEQELLVVESVDLKSAISEIKACLELGQFDEARESAYKTINHHPEALDNWHQIASLWSEVVSRTPPSTSKVRPKLNQRKPKIVLVLVSHGRLACLQRTLGSLSDHCSDFELIDRVYCLLEEKHATKTQKITRYFPQIEVRTASTLVQAQEELRKELIREEATYVVQLEDSYQFVVKAELIRLSIDLLEAETDLGQVVFNRNYAITLDDITSDLGQALILDPKNQRQIYFRHVYGKGKNATWPHFSFQPGLHRLSAWKELGAFEAVDTEVDYAWRYWKAGFRTGFLPLIYSIKVDDPVKAVRQLPFSVQVINLARRSDRWAKFSGKFAATKFTIQRFDATDGLAVTLNAQEKQLFEGNTFHWRAGIVGCALSHYRLWQQLIQDQTSSAYLILEDDLELGKNFEAKLTKLAQIYRSQIPQPDLVYLGASILRNKRTPERYDPQAQDFTFRVWADKDVAITDTYWNGGAFAYIISKEAASLCCAEIKAHGITMPIDCILFKLFPKLTVFETVPYLIYTEYVDARVDKAIDSDIQMTWQEVKR